MGSQRVGHDWVTELEFANHFRFWVSLDRKWKALSCVRLFVTPWTIQSMESFRPEYWSGQPIPSPGDLSNPGIKHRSPLLQVDSLPAEPQGKPKNTRVGSLSLLQLIFWPRNWTGVSCIAGGFFTNWAIREALKSHKSYIIFVKLFDINVFQ